MYTVIDFKLPKGAALTIRKYVGIDFFRMDDEVRPDHIMEIEVPNSGCRKIELTKYLTGENVTLRKSLTGLRLVRGLPDYSGKVKRADLTENIRERAQEYQSFFKAYEAQRTYDASKKPDWIRGSNLCQEIEMPMVDSLTVQRSHYPELSEMLRSMPGIAAREREWQEMITQTAQSTRQGRSRGIDIEAMSQLMAYSAGIGTRDMYYTRGGTVTGRSTARTQPSHRFNQQMLTMSDFDGDAIGDMSLYEARAIAPRYLDNRYEVAPVSLTEVALAAAEVARGERGTPPASRGPRPRNQRW